MGGGGTLGHIIFLKSLNFYLNSFYAKKFDNIFSPIKIIKDIARKISVGRGQKLEGAKINLPGSGLRRREKFVFLAKL